MRIIEKKEYIVTYVDRLDPAAVYTKIMTFTDILDFFQKYHRFNLESAIRKKNPESSELYEVQEIN